MGAKHVFGLTPGFVYSTIRLTMGTTGTFWLGRVNLERVAPFRIDLGFSDEGPDLTVGFRF